MDFVNKSTAYANNLRQTGSTSIILTNCALKNNDNWFSNAAAGNLFLKLLRVLERFSGLP